MRRIDMALPEKGSMLFTVRCYASVVYAVDLCLSVTSQYCTMNIVSRKQCYTIAHGL